MVLFSRTFFVLLTILYLQSLCRGDIASRLKKRYSDTRTECKVHGKIKPAYECSGIMIRGIDKNNNFRHCWSLKPRNKNKKSFSVAYLRKDTPFESFPRGYDAGFIIYPHLSTPQKKNTYKVYCAFPVNGGTDYRNGRHACGQSKTDTAGTSKHCDQLGITSYDEWVKHYDQIMTPGGDFVLNQCAFDMTTKSAAKNFATFLKANYYLGTSNKYNNRYKLRNNELLVHLWNDKKARVIPIEAFFYLMDKNDKNEAYDKAKKYQEDFEKHGGGKKPIVGIRLPTATNPMIHIIKR